MVTMGYYIVFADSNFPCIAEQINFIGPGESEDGIPRKLLRLPWGEEKYFQQHEVKEFDILTLNAWYHNYVFGWGLKGPKSGLLHGEQNG
jgi:hypothetical protein